MEAKFKQLKDKVLIEIKGEKGNEEMIFKTDKGETYRMFHNQNCCESVIIEDICGDLSDLLNSPVLLAEESTSNKNPKGVKMGYQDSFTWTFYKLSTIKGSVTIRWYGESNGYYSEDVDFELEEV